MTQGIDSVLLIGFGGPTAPSEVRPFLANVVRGRNVPPERLEEVAHHYEVIGGHSPYNTYTLAQAAALREHLAATGRDLPVEVGMRNWAPYLAEAITRLRERECRRAAGLILAPHRSQTSWERYQLDVEGARQEAGQGLEVLYPPAWHTNPLFIEAIADRIAEAAGIPEDRKKEREEERPAAHVVFTAHSIPAGMAADSNYAAEIRATSELVAARVGAANWSVAYQSASGDGRTPWLGPDIDEEIRGLRQRGVDSVILCPVGFLCDHVEVLYDLDVEARATAAELGIRFARAGTVGTHPQFIRLLAELVGAL